MKEIKTLEDLHEVMELPINAVIKIGSETCGPCKITEQNIKEAAGACTMTPELYKIDCDECDEEIISELNVRNIPTVICRKNNETAWRASGLLTADRLTRNFNAIYGDDGNLDEAVE